MTPREIAKSDKLRVTVNVLNACCLQRFFFHSTGTLFGRSSSTHANADVPHISTGIQKDRAVGLRELTLQESFEAKYSA